MLIKGREFFRVDEAYQPLMRLVGLDAQTIFSDPRIVAWRRLPDRENCTLDADMGRGRAVRLHIKRFAPASSWILPARLEAAGHRLLIASKIPTAALIGWGGLRDRRSFLIYLDLEGYQAADKLIESGTPFDQLLNLTADLAAKLHRANVHHCDLYLCHFMVRPGTEPDVKLIDAARVATLASSLRRRHWIIKDLSQFWYSTLALPITDQQRQAWLTRYLETSGVSAKGLQPAIERKARWIARHDLRLRARQPNRNISIPTKAPEPQS